MLEKNNLEEGEFHNFKRILTDLCDNLGIKLEWPYNKNTIIDFIVWLDIGWPLYDDGIRLMERIKLELGCSSDFNLQTLNFFMFTFVM